MVEVAFYIANKGKLYDKVVSYLTCSKYSHVELVINDVCYSSSNRDGGVRSKVINLSDGKWELIAIECNAKHKIYEFYEATKNCKYDWLSVVMNLVFKMNKDFMIGRYHCFEWVINAINIANKEYYNPNMNINDFYKLCKQLELIYD